MASNTADEKFHILNGETIKVPFLKSFYVYHSYASLDDFKVLKLRYERVIGDDGKPVQFSMYLLLPHDTYGLQDMVEKFHLDQKLLAPKILNNHLRKVKLSRVSIPKMKFSYDVDSMELLEEKGLTLPSLRVKQISQKWYKGCFCHLRFEIEAECDSDSSPPPLPTFDADHPFMFMIVEQFSNLVVFTGAVLDPRKYFLLCNH
ncbi:hypothetical protein CsatB_010359 [Cannabis sativa]